MARWRSRLECELRPVSPDAENLHAQVIGQDAKDNSEWRFQKNPAIIGARFTLLLGVCAQEAVDSLRRFRDAKPVAH